MIGFLNGDEASGLPLAELEARLEAERQELVNALMQDHAELPAVRGKAIASARVTSHRAGR